MSGYVRMVALLGILSIVPALAGDSPHFTAEGVVLGPDGKALSGAQVSLYITEYEGGVRPDQERTTGADGRYAFAVERPAAHHAALIAAHKEGLAWNCHRWLLLADLEADIRLARPTELAGRVVDEQTEPIAGARVSLQALCNDHLRSFHISEGLARTLFTTETDAQGWFRFGTLSADWRTDFLIQAAGYATVRSQNLPDYLYTVYGPGQEGIQFTMKPEARIRGKVVSETDSAPLEGIKVRMGRTETGVAYGFESAVSDEAGAFAFRGIPEGDFWVGVATSHVPDTGWVAWPVSVQTKAGETTEDVKLELSRGGMFEVKVVDSAGVLVEGAGLTIFGREGSRLAQGRSAATGLWAVRLPAGDYKLVDVGRRGYHTYEPFIFFDIEVGQIVRREVTLKKAGRIGGIVVDADGRPVCDVRLSLMPSPTGATYSDKRGRFTMIWDKWLSEHEDAKTKEFELTALDVKGGRTGSVKLQGQAGEIRLVLEPAVRVTGAVVDSGGEPVERALVSSWLKGPEGTWGMNLHASERVLTDRSGRFTIFPVPAGRTCEISARAIDHDKVKKEFQTPADTAQPFDIGTIKLAPKSADGG
ncbi:MAG: hypothetical protein ACYTAS_14420 [Planctomycetota bacterium]|jgi:hypothetical protein